MAKPYSTTGQVLNRVLATLCKDAAWNLADPGTVAVADITFVQLAVGPYPVTVAYVGGGTAGSEVVTVSSQNAITVKIQAGTSTATQVLAKINASAAALALVSASITGTGSNVQAVSSAPVIVTGDIVLRIMEADNEVDTRLASMGYALPFATNPPALQDLSKLLAIYICFRDLYAAGQPTENNPHAETFKARFEEKLMHLEEGWAQIVDMSSTVVPNSKFQTITAPYPCPTQTKDNYPNAPNGPYADPPGVDAY